MDWRVHHREVTESTNLDARGGAPGDVWTADLQTAGRGRLDHRWLSAKGENLMMSAVLDVAGVEAAEVATLPLVAGLAVARAVRELLPQSAPRALVKWPNDVLVGGRKLAGILCQRDGDRVIAGIGVNVRERAFAPEIAGRAVSLAMLAEGPVPEVAEVRDRVLASLASEYARWREGGFGAIREDLAKIDALRGSEIAVLQTDADTEPIRGICGGISSDGSLLVGGRPVYAGEAHVIGSSAVSANRLRVLL